MDVSVLEPDVVRVDVCVEVSVDVSVLEPDEVLVDVCVEVSAKASED